MQDFREQIENVNWKKENYSPVSEIILVAPAENNINEIPLVDPLGWDLALPM